MAATMSRSSSRSSWLPDSEAQEFNQVTYERIKSYTDISKLKRLERYMREEGFSKTAELTRQTIVEKGGKDPYDTEHCVNDVDVDNVLKSINSWQASIKDIDSRLQELQQTKGQDISNGESNSFLKVDSMCPKVRERVKGMQSITHETETLEKKLKPHLKNDLRSGREYYSQWDKYISQWEKDSEKCMEIGNEVDSIEDRVSTIKDNQKTRKIKQITYKSQLEREWIAQREREKGNDLFKAKEYTASLQAYNLSIQLFSGSALAYANRAAVNLKMQRWDDAYEDCCKAIDIDPNYSKAFLRRAMASLEMDKPEEALKDLEVADSMETASEEVRKLKIEAEKKVSKKFQERFSHSDCTHQTVGSKCESLPRGARRLAIEEVNGTTENTKNKVNAQCCEVENSGISKTNKVETSEPHNLNKSSPIVKQFSADEWHKKGNLHYSNGEYMEAESCYSKYLTSDPNNVIVLSNRSMCRLKLCKYEEAEVDATQAIMISPGFVKAYYRRGLARRSLGKLWEAKEDLQHGRNLNGIFRSNTS